MTADGRSSSFRIVVIGAGEVAGVVTVLRGLPAHCGFAVVVQCPGAAALTTDALELPVEVVRRKTLLVPDRVYVIPADHEGSFQRGDLVVAASSQAAPTDRLLRSLADEQGVAGAAVLLGARGDDGVLGIKRLKEAGGLTIVQVPQARNFELPRAAIATGVIDLVLEVDDIAPRLLELTCEPRGETGRPADERGEGASDVLRDILTLVRVRSGHDFSSYKRATLYRRVSRRMQVRQCESIASYHLYLREHPEELGHLLRDFLISVTCFFRDPAAFGALNAQVIPALFAGKGAGDQVRVWVAGCATGEEAYTVGMLLCEYAAQLADPPALQIFATDIDEDALADARIGRYPSTIIADVGAERLQRFFTQDGEQFRVSKELREVVLFSPHNVLRDPPFSRLDLITCRNVLIYLNREAQDRVLHVFHFGLKPDGYLMLGSSESAESTQLFTGSDAKHRLFARRASGVRVAGETIITSAREPLSLVAPPVHAAERTSVGELHHRVVELYAPPSILVSDELDILHVSERAGRFLRVAAGEPSHQLLRLVEPALRADLRTAIYAARQSARGSDSRIVRFEDDGAVRAVEIRVRATRGAELGRASLLVFLDEIDAPPVSETDAGSETVLEPVMRELEDELRRTRDQLRTTIEQYETSLEEIKASNEELQAINEELRSASEELETSKEELQSVNEELTTLNQELKLRVDEVSHANSDLQNLMTSTDIGVVFLDRALNIKRFTPRVQDLFNMIPSDIGRPLGDLTHRLDSGDLPALARAVLQTLRGESREVRSHDGRRYQLRLLPYRSLEDRIDGVVLTFVEVTDLHDAIAARRKSEAALQATQARLELALRTAPMLVVSFDRSLQVVWGYVLGEELTARSPRLADLMSDAHAAQLLELARSVLASGVGRRAELALGLPGGARTFDFRIERTVTEAGAGVEAVGFDITPSKRAEAALREADRRKDLLDLSRLPQDTIQIERTPVEVVAVVEAALAASRPLITQRHHQLRVELPPRAVRVSGDLSRLTQVLTNLLDNAAKYTPEGGQLALVVAADVARQVLVIRMHDNGDGVAAESMHTIFDSAVLRGAAEGRSGGLGLPLVRRLVELHGGTVDAVSPGPGQGATFTVELPLA